MGESTDDKSEKATPKKLRDTRKDGRVAKSNDLNIALSSLAASAVLVWLGPLMMSRLAASLARGLREVGSAAGRDLKPEDLTSMVFSNVALLAFIVAPIALAAAAAGVGSAAAQGGLQFAPKALRLSLAKLSPLNGLKRLAPSMAWIDMAKAIITVVVLSSIALQIGKALALEGARFAYMPTLSAAGRGWESVADLLWKTGFALLALGVGDYALQRWRLMKSLKMTKQEVRDEGKSSEGSPEIKQRVRQVQREIARRSMLQDTAHATVVITNPTHSAVALEYQREKNPAPVVVAKGRDLLAQQIRDIARKNGVPIIENRSLAHALHEGAEVGQAIPASLFGAVAEVLGYLVRIKQLMM
jgi:flagellar biosynthetic protein FlhB